MAPKQPPGPPEEPAKPKSSGHYRALGLCWSATSTDIKKAFRRLALVHHPDKKGPGHVKDDTDFKRVREAYEYLRDEERRKEYVEIWMKYRTEFRKYREEYEHYRKGLDVYEDDQKWKEDRRKHKEKMEHKKREKAQKAAEKQIAREQQRVLDRILNRFKEWELANLDDLTSVFHRASDLPRVCDLALKSGIWCICDRCTVRRSALRKIGFTKEEIKVVENHCTERAFRDEMQRENEHLEQERKVKARINREKETIERNKQARKRVAQTRSERVLREERERQTRDAQRVLAEQWIAKKRIAQLEELRQSGQELSTNEVVIDIGWTKKKGASQCLFCGDEILHFSFQCPHGDAVACNACKKRLSRFHPCETKGSDVSQGAGSD